MEETPYQRIEAYLARSNEYWSQALSLIQAGELEKASELAWGSVAERVKVLALARHGVLLPSHAKVIDYVKRIAAQTGDKELKDNFSMAERLHANFYESFLDDNDVKEIFIHIPVLLGKIDNYLRGGQRQ